MTAPDYMAAGRRPDRPVGITLLTILHFAGGAALSMMAIALLTVFRGDPRVADALAHIGIPLSFVIAGAASLAFLSLVSAYGMYSGAQWGWYVGSFSYIYSILRNVDAVFSIKEIFASLPADQLAGAPHGVGFYHTKFAIRAVISLLIYLYFFKDNVRAYFGLQGTKLWPAVLVQIGVCIAISVFFAMQAN